MVLSKFLKVTTWGRISTKCDQKLGNKIEKIWHALKESNVWGSNSNITWDTQVLMTSICDILYLWWLRKTFHLELTYLPNWQTAIYHIKILTQHEMAPNMFNNWLNIPLRNQCSMHGNDENMLFWSQFKLRITFQLQFLEWIFFFFFFFGGGGKKLI